MLSFIPDDLGWCDWIYGELQGHEVPLLLSGQGTRDGTPLPEYLTAFPDRFDPDHFERYPEALATSRFLIVVCTPESSGSPEIEAHIRAFKDAGGGERIIALIAAREPHAGQEKWPRSPNSEWLPNWLQWRFSDDGAFFLADHTEPQIVEARPGWASLDEVKVALIAALLEITPEELEELENATLAPIPTLAPMQEVVALSGNEMLVETAPVAIAKRASRHRGLVIGATIGVLAGIAAMWTNHMKLAADLPAPKVEQAREQATVAAPLRALPKVTQPLEKSVPTDLTATQPQTPETAVEPPPLEPPPAEFLGPPPPTAADLAAAEDARLRREKSALATRADALVVERDLPLALQTYSRALTAAKRFSAEPGAQLDSAEIYRKMGTLQAQIESTAEARYSFEKARKILNSLRASGQLGKQRARILEDVEHSLHTLPRD